MKKLVKAITEEIFESWDKQTQDKWLKDHPTSKFKNLDKIKQLRQSIKTKQTFKPSDYADSWKQGNIERQEEEKDISQIQEQLKRLERKPLRRLIHKPLSPLKKYKLPQKDKPSFSKELQPFNNFSKETGIRNIDDLKTYADKIFNKRFQDVRAKNEYNKLADNLLEKYKGIIIHSKDLDPNEKKMIQMLAIYKKEKEFYNENEKKKESSIYKKWLQLKEQSENENRKLKPLMQQWYNIKGQEEKTEGEEKLKLHNRRVQLGKELHNKRVAVDNLIKQANTFEQQNREKFFPDAYPIQEPIFGKPNIEPEKLGLKKIDI